MPERKVLSSFGVLFGPFLMTSFTERAFTIDIASCQPFEDSLSTCFALELGHTSFMGLTRRIFFMRMVFLARREENDLIVGSGSGEMAR